MPVSVPFPAQASPSWPQSPTRPSLYDQLLSLRRRWRLIILFAAAFPAAAAMALTFVPARFTATGILLYDPAEGAAPGVPAPSVDALDQDAITASQGAIITSLPSAAALADRLSLGTLPEFNPDLRRHGWISRLLQPSPPKGDTASQAVALAAQKALAVNLLSGSRVLAVSFTSQSPVVAAAGANVAMQLYLAHERRQSFDLLEQAQSWLSDNSLKLQNDLDLTETALAKARAAAGIVSGTQATLTTEEASRINASLLDAKATLAMAQSRLTSAADGDAAAANAAIAPSLEPLRKEQADLEARVRALSRLYGDNYPDLVSARSSLAAIDSEIEAEMGRELQAEVAEVAADKAQVATLTAALDAARAQSQAQEFGSTTTRALEQRADSERAMLRSVALQADQLAQQSALIKPDARILSEAAQPIAPSSPNRVVILSAFALLGLGLGVLTAGLADALDTSLRSGGDLRLALGLPCLAVVPEIRAPREAPLKSPFSVFSEQMRALRTGLFLENQQRAVRIVAVTSARPGEGKTTLTIALARALADSGLRVLAVDGDIRQPSFDAIFNRHGAPGLTDLLMGLVPLEAAILEDQQSALQVIAAGTQGRDALSLFLAPEFRQLLEGLRTRYDYVLLDVPPALALAEGRVLARLADAAVLCVRWGKTPRRVAQAAMTVLQEAGVPLVGAALTRVNAARYGRSGFVDSEIYQPRYGGYFNR